jgi:glycosyltransferase involved in cell wall biosynthesis
MEGKTKTNFIVSVIIPVFNAEKFLEKAVLSAVELKEVGEVILIEDASPDNVLNICNRLEIKYKKVKLIRHPKGDHLGAGASRNLGIKLAHHSYIAFLDADDWYLSNRFLKDKKIFDKFPKADAVYSSVVKSGNKTGISKMYGVNFDIRRSIGFNASKVEFYKNILSLRQVPFHTNSVTFKKDFLLQGKLFDERLKLHQDTELWNRLIRRGYFYTGEFRKPVAVIRKHKNNRITSRSITSVLKMYAVFIENVGVDNLYEFEKTFLLKTILRLKSKSITNNWIRRLNYYSRYYIWISRKRIFLQKIEQETLSN